MEPEYIRQDISATWDKLIKPTYRAHLCHQVSCTLNKKNTNIAKTIPDHDKQAHNDHRVLPISHSAQVVFFPDFNQIHADHPYMDVDKIHSIDPELRVQTVDSLAICV